MILGLLEIPLGVLALAAPGATLAATARPLFGGPLP